jgi:1-acyl-sn-glycerol-3-phosphate acyltransferase
MPFGASRLFVAITRLLVGPLFRLDVRGAEQVPRSGKLIIVANRARRFLDALVLVAATPRELVIVGHSDLERRPIAGLFARLAGTIFVVPSVILGAGLLAACERSLTRGLALGIFPEGLEMRGGHGRFKRGAAYLALRNACAVVPAWIERGRFGRFRVVYGAPLVPGEGGVNRQTVESFTAALQQAVLALRPAD